MPIYHLPDTHQPTAPLPDEQPQVSPAGAPADSTAAPPSAPQSGPSEPRRAIRHIVALKLAANAVARYEYETELWQLTQAQQRICEGLAATAVGAYMNAVQKGPPRSR
jgi:hypothetical protein